MPEHYSKRTGYAPWSLTREAGVQSATVNSDIEVPQVLQPVLNTGFIDEKGDWKGSKSDDEQFIGLTKAEAIPNGADALFPDTNNFTHIDMSGFKTLQFALNVTNGGTYNVVSVYGPDTVPYANLSPVQPAEPIRIIDNISQADEALFSDNITISYANTWFVMTILADRAKGQKNMQVKVTNSSGGVADIQFGFRRLV